MYKLKKNGVIRLSDNANIPNNLKNPDWRKYQTWLSKKGNKPEPEFTPKELLAKKQSDTKRKESELVQVKIQFDTAKSENLSIADDYSKQLTKLRKEHADLVA